MGHSHHKSQVIHQRYELQGCHTTEEEGKQHVYLEKPYWCTPTQLQSHIVTARVAGGACRERREREEEEEAGNGLETSAPMLLLLANRWWPS